MRVGVVAIVVAAASAMAAPPAEAADYRDPAGDAGGAPDVTAVSVAATDASISFRVTLADMVALDREAELFLAIDTDRSTATGDRHGVDFVYSLRDGGVVLRTRRWSGTQHVPFSSSATGRFEAGVATFVVPLAELGHPAAIGFGAIGSRGGDSDAAPDNGSWSFRLRAALRVTSVTARFTPTAPRSGRVFRLAGASGALSDGTNRTGTAVCTARVGSAKLSGRGCSWRLAAGVRGKRLTISVRVLVPDVGARTRVYLFRIS